MFRSSVDKTKFSSRNALLSGLFTATVTAALMLVFTGAGHAQISFTGSDLQGANPSNPTTLQFGPDGRLYAGQQDGTIQVYTISRNGPSDYQVTATETITLIQEMVNHDDDGSQSAEFSRQVTGLLVTGTPSAPVLYVTSSDPRIGAGGSGTDTNLDTNSGVISRLDWNGSDWDKLDLVSGLPRSEENHSQNGMQLDEINNILYVTSGGNTNAGAPSNNFAFATEYALAAAILSVDLDAIEALPVQFDAANNRFYVYDLPTLDDPDRANNPDGSDPGDPFGGNDGLNQAKLVPGGPVQIYSPGWRNVYDVVITSSPGREGRMYTVDNGANGGWGGHPDNEGPAGNCTNDYVIGEPGFVNNLDNFHFIPFEGYYGGHPTPIRGNPSGAGLYWYDNGGNFDPSPTADWPPVPPSQANPVECDFLLPGVEDGALATFVTSTNGLVEYTASNFSGQMQGDLLTASFDNTVYRMTLNQAGDQLVAGPLAFASNFGPIPLDVTAQGDLDIFPGTVWVAVYAGNKITVFEPDDYDGGGPGNCTGNYDPLLDEDSDGYNNADEIDNGSDPCSAASKPPDNDGDFISDLNDPDDDNDGVPDTTDPFAIDPDNGQTTDPPVVFQLFNGQPGTGFFGVGFTGLMTNGDDYANLFDPDIIVAGGAAGLFTIEQVSQGDALGSLNSQTNAMQFGINLTDQTGPFTILTRLVAPFFNGQTPQDFQSQGMYLGTGDQDNYVKLALNANGGSGGIQVVIEQDGTVVQDIQFSPAGVLASTFVDLYLTVDPATGFVQPSYAIEGVPLTQLGTPLAMGGTLLSALTGPNTMAVGVIATSRGAATFAATWDFIELYLEPATSQGLVEIIPPGGINASTFSPGSFLIENTSLEGQQITTVQIDLTTAIFPDMVFDPDGTAGDTTAKGFTVDSDPGVGLTGHSYAGPHNGIDGDDGWDILEIQFTDFDPGEVFTFSIDNDPTSIKGAPAPGPGESGSVSGLEMAGATVTMQFDDGFTHIVQTFQTPGSLSGSENIVRRVGPPRAGISVLGISDDPVTVPNAQQTVRVTGPGGMDVSLLVVEGALFTQGLPGGGYDLDPFEANSAIEVQEINGTVGPTGFLDIPIVLTDSDPDGGLNYIMAALRDIDGMAGRSSRVIVLEYDPSIVPSPFMNINTGGPAVSTGGVVWEADQYFTGFSTPYSNPIPIEGTTDDILYHSERYGASFGYAVPVTNGTYVVNLHFAEIYFGAPGGGGGGVGSREFDFDIENGQAGLLGFDILAEVNPAEALIKSFPDIDVSDGVLDISFTAIVDNAKISAIEILESSPGGPTAILQVIPTLLDFGQQAVGFTSFNPVVLTNTGNSPLNVTGLTITGPDAAEFGFDLVPPFQVNPGTPVTLTMDFTPQTAGLKSATLTILHTGDNPAMTVDLSGQGEAQAAVLQATPASLDFGQQSVGTTFSNPVDLTNTGNTTLDVTDLSITGPDASAFSFDLTPPFQVDPGSPVTLNVSFSPLIEGSMSATLTISHTGDNPAVTVDLSGQGVEAGSVLFRVNAGGPQTPSGDGSLPDWSEDLFFSPSPYVNTGAAGNTVFATGAAISLDGTVPTGAPTALFQSERWDSAAPAEQQWSFPVADGTYRVNLYFAEIYTGIPGAGGRFFDVAIEGTTVLDDFDIVAETGDLFIGTMRSFLVDVIDGELNVELLHEFENPKISAIEILSGTPPPPTANLAANPALLDLGQQLVGSVSSGPIDLTNTGNTPLDVTDMTITGPDAPDFSLDLVPPFAVVPGAPVTLTVSFAPLTAGPKSATLTISHTGDNPAVTVDLSGQGEALTAILQTIPSSIDFGQQAVGSNASNPVTLTNTGNTSLDVTDLAITGPDASEFSFDLVPPFSVDPGTPVLLNVSFAPQTSGLKSATLTISHTGDNPDVTVGLSGEGTGLTAVLQATPGSVDFGLLAVGSTLTSPVDLTNTGNSSLDVTGLAITGPDAAEFGFDLTPPFPVAPGTPVTLTLDFSPLTAGPKSATLTISHTGDNPDVTVDLSGQGEALAAILQAIPNSIDFGQQPVGTTFSNPVDLTNTGNTSLDVTDLAITGPDAGEFSFDLTPPFQIDPGTPVTLNVSFSPLAEGPKTATLTISHTGDNPAVTVDLSGQGLEAGDVLFRVNAGGPLEPSGDGSQPDWDTDLFSSPSPYVNTGAAGNTAFITGATITPDGSVPASAPAALFQSERWDSAAPAEQEWSFPVADGTYQVNLYFAEIYTGILGAGDRVFDVVIEGTTVLDDYDIVADTGDLFIGTMKSFQADVTDGELTITLLHEVQNPKISAIEIVSTTPPPPTAILAANPALLDLGQQLVGTSSSGNVDLTNTGNTILDVTDMTITGPDAPDFDVDLTPPFPVVPGAPVTLTVSFTPLSAGPKSATLTISHNGDNPAVTVDLSGQGEALSAILQAIPSSIDFGLLLVGSNLTNPVVLTNTGNTSLNVTDLAISGPDASEFSFDLVPPFSVDPGTPVTLTLEFLPQTAGIKSATLTISHDGDNPAVTVDLSGQGEGLAAILQATPSSIDFGQQAVGLTLANPVDLTNTGNTPLDVTDFTITGPDASEFSVDLIPPFQLDPGSPVVLNVSFSPLTEGPKSATLTISHTGDNPAATVDLSGQAFEAVNVLYRVNAGGSQTASADGSQPDWSEDEFFSPSPYVNTGAAGNSTFSTGASITLDGSVSASAPPALFQSERWDSAFPDEQEWSFPVPDGTYQVNLYFAEIYTGIQGAGERVFDVAIEGTTVLDDYDIVADTGDLFIGTMQTFLADVVDGELNIQLLHEVENPKISAIEILEGGG